MTDFTIHTLETAPTASKPMLDRLKKAIGFLPGLYGVLAEAPKALEAYDVLAKLFKGTSLTTTEQHVVWLTINYENNCGYCVPAHTGLAKMDAVRGLTIVPAQVAGIDDRVGSLEPGKDADIVVLTGDPADPRHGVEVIWIEGKRVYQAEGVRRW